jgi:hypothetical protein
MVSIINNDGAGREVKKERKLRCKVGGGGAYQHLNGLGCKDARGWGKY